MYKRQGKAGNGVRKHSVSLVWRRVAYEENNWGLKISVIRIDRVIVIVYVKEYKTVYETKQLLLFTSSCEQWNTELCKQ